MVAVCKVGRKGKGNAKVVREALRVRYENVQMPQNFILDMARALAGLKIGT
jgi:hypothetical protein